MNKKGSGGGGAGIVVVIIGVIIGILILVNHLAFFAQNFIHECRDNQQCSGNQYCGSDFKCHDFPITNQNIVQEYNSYNLIGPALIIAIGLVLGSYVLRKKETKEDKQDWRTYYKQQTPPDQIKHH